MYATQLLKVIARKQRTTVAEQKRRLSFIREDRGTKFNLKKALKELKA